MVTRYDILVRVSKSFRGSKCYLAAPKSHFVEDIHICNDVQYLQQIFYQYDFLAAVQIWKVKKNAMMNARWKKFHFTYQIPDSEQENFIVCPKCFS